MAQIILPGDPPIEVALRVSNRARRLSLRVSRLDGRVRLTLPDGARIGEARAFLREREGWIRGHLAQAPAPIRPRPGGRLLFEGRELALVAGNGRAARLVRDRGRDGDRSRGRDVITLPRAAPERSGALLAALLKRTARTRLDAACAGYANALGLEFTALTLRDTRSRWGSCSPAGRLMFSWRLVMAPPQVLRYVAAHEVAHLAEMNHSPAFWAQVERLMPGYRIPRDWLRENGALLHAYRFGD